MKYITINSSAMSHFTFTLDINFTYVYIDIYIYIVDRARRSAQIDFAHRQKTKKKITNHINFILHLDIAKTLTICIELSSSILDINK